MNPIGQSVAILSLLAASDCEVSVNKGNGTAEASNDTAPGRQRQRQNPQDAQRAQIRGDARRGLQDLHFLVDISDRKLRLMQSDRQMAEHTMWRSALTNGRRRPAHGKYIGWI